MRLEQLYIFCKTVETGSVRKAGEALYTSPQNASKAIRQLETEWNTTLFHRSRTGMQLTAEGEQAYSMVQKILDDVESLNQYFHIPSHGSTFLTSVSIISCSALEVLVTSICNSLLPCYTNIHLEIDKKGSVQIRDYLLSLRKTDEISEIILTNEIADYMDLYKKKLSSLYHCFFLYEDELCLQVPKNDPLAKYEYIPLDVLVNLPLLLYSATPKQKTQSELLLQEMGYELKNVSRTASIETCSQIAMNLHKYCFVGYPSVEFRPMANVTYIPLEKTISSTEIILLKKGIRKEPFINAFFDLIDSYFGLKRLW
ncbi:MAG: LysR family transcriptional regulator [Lachnospiraceae bacterium]|nr:LysR family transcriptional regulator [Lachnospiraceae bacterium]